MQNPVAEFWLDSCRREMLGHVVVFAGRHPVRLMNSCVGCYQGDGSHLGSAKVAPDRRSITPRPWPTGKIVALPRVGGLHHGYEVVRGRLISRRLHCQMNDDDIQPVDKGEFVAG